ncbi:MAG: hypothetical protein ACD_22C00076G0003 [uncultured bacterium]|nr:MAG: hypothetical protein ACD_22C00076G0003 [uncultured bacterium]
MLKKNKLKILIIVGLIGSLLIFVAIRVVVNLKSSNRLSSSVTVFDLENIIHPKATKECQTTGSIHYFYYSNPTGEDLKNNKFGIYIYAENKDFFELAQNLVNSKGGDWGYVLIPFNVKDRDSSKWGRVFDQLYQKHLIPVVQLWDLDVANYKEDTKGAAEFLNEFVWPIRQRYISVYNEPNDAKFWKGKVDPAEYARILKFTMAAFRDESLDFFMLNGALNASASDFGDTMDSDKFMTLMNQEIPGIFNDLDGWATHSYPQPNFSGSVSATGRWSIKAYDYELNLLRDQFDIQKDLPVFITETGWAHAEGENYNSSYLPVKTVGERFKQAYEDVWLKDDRVMAVMPFTVRYDPPFDHFSWVNADNVPYEHYDVVKSMKKVKGNPAKLELGDEVSLGCEELNNTKK